MLNFQLIKSVHDFGVSFLKTSRFSDRIVDSILLLLFSSMFYELLFIWISYLDQKDFLGEFVFFSLEYGLEMIYHSST